MSARWSVVAFVAGGVLGAGSMWLALGHATPPDALLQRSAGEGASLARQECPSTDVEAIRAVVRQELRAAAALQPPSAAPVQPVAVAAAPPPAKEEAAHADEAEAKPPSPQYGEAQRLIEGGLMRRTWSAQDRSQLQVLMPRLSPAERETLAKQLIVAANRGELKVDLVGPLF